MDYSPENIARPHRNSRKHFHRQCTALAKAIIFSRIGAPAALSVQQARQTARAVSDSEESDDDVDDQVDREGSCWFIGTKAAKVVC